MPVKSIKQSFSESLLANFQKLHDAFMRLTALQPWTIVHESIILGVQHPQTREIYYAYFMGELGEIVGFNLYKGQHVAPWLEVRQDLRDFSEEEMLSHTYYQLTASKKTGLPAEIKDLHVAAGITVPKGKAGYLEAVHYKGGYTVVMMDEAEMADVLPLIPGFIYLLENIAGGGLQDAEALDERHAGYVAEPDQEGTWHAVVKPLPPPEKVNLFEINPPDLLKWAGIKMLPKAKEAFIIHTQLFPMPTRNDEGIGIFPLALICVGAVSELILGLRLLDVGTWRDGAAPALLEMFEGLKAQPIAFHVADEQALPLAEACARALSIHVEQDDHAALILGDILDSLGGSLGF